MPRFSQAHAAPRALAALLLALALLSGCGAGEQRRPDPFAQGLPTPTNTAGVQATPVVQSTPGAASTATAVPTATLAGPATAAQPGSAPTATGALTPALPAETAAPATGAPSTATAAPTAAPSTSATPAPQPESPSTPTPPATPSPTPPVTTVSATTAPAARTRVYTAVPTNTPTLPPAATPTPAPPVATSTWTPAPTPTQEDPVGWSLARDEIGMWEFEGGEDWRYYFDFLPGGRVIVAQNGLRNYQVRDSRTLVIQMPEYEWSLTVVDLAADRLVLKNFVNETDEFRRVPGVPALASRLVGLWLDESGVYPSLEFTADGLAVGKFGRGVYEVASGSSVLITCARPQDCDPYRAFGQDVDAPAALRVHEVTGSTLTVEGFGSNQPWTLGYREGISDLAGGLVGRWVREPSSIEFGGNGGLVLDDEIYGHYEVLGRSTFWIEYDGQEEGQSWVVVRLTGTELAFAEWGSFYEDDLWTFERESP